MSLWEDQSQFSRKKIGANQNLVLASEKMSLEIVDNSSRWLRISPTSKLRESDKFSHPSSKVRIMKPFGCLWWFVGTFWAIQNVSCLSSRFYLSRLTHYKSAIKCFTRFFTNHPCCSIRDCRISYKIYIVFLRLKSCEELEP